MEGWPGQRWGSSSQRSMLSRAASKPEAGAGGPGGAGGRRREIEDGCRPLDVNPTANLSESFVD